MGTVFRKATNGDFEAVWQIIADAKRLMAACYLITGTCYQPAVECGRICLGRWCTAVRERYHAEACNGFNYLRAADNTTDPCLQRLLTELGESSYRQAEALLCLLQRSL